MTGGGDDTSPQSAPPGVRWRPDVVYGTAGAGGRDLAMHLYAGKAGERRPGIVFVHGGGWQVGGPAMMFPLAAEMAAQGYVTAAISYRLAGEARWPAALEDTKCAVRWMRANAVGIGLDPDRIAVAGGSAGGQLAALVALTAGRWEGTGGLPGVVSAAQAAVLYNPVLDLRLGTDDNLLGSTVKAYLGDDAGAAVQAEASPVAQVTSSVPPVLTRVGDQDLLTPAATCAAFHRALGSLGVPNELEIVAGADHGLPVNDLAGCVRATTAFLARYL